MNDLSLNVSKTINASIEDVFDAWLDPAMLVQFILPMPGMPRPEVKNDPRQGGSFTIVMHVGEDEIPHTGEYLELDRPNRLVFSWASPFSIDGSKVTIDFNAIDDSTTNVELTQVRFVDEEAQANHEAGWSNILEVLDDVLSESVTA